MRASSISNMNLLIMLMSLINLPTVLMEYYDGIVFEPLGEAKNRSIYLVKAGVERFGITCIYNGERAHGQHAMQWINENDEAIFTSSSIVVLANAKNKYSYEKKLVFTNIKKHDTGEYRCRVQLKDADFVEKAIFIKVISNIEWNTPEDRVAGNLGEQLTVDCGARGNPAPTIEIAGPRGQSIKEIGYTVIDNKVTIPKLSEEHQNFTIKCLAIQRVNVVDQFNTTTADEHEIVVDVYFPPRFEFPEVEIFTSTGKNATLQCLVMASYPRVAKFDFYRDNSIIFNHERYEVSTDFVHQMATLRITGVEDDDYGRYRCVAKSIKLSGEQVLVLKKTAPPKQPFVKILNIGNNSVTFEIIDNREEDDLPVLCYSISYVPREYRLSGTIADGKDPQNKYKTTTSSERRSIKFHINASNSYAVKHLEPNIKYEFLIKPINEVGEGDPVMQIVITHPQSSDQQVTFNAASASYANLLNFVVFYVLISARF